MTYITLRLNNGMIAIEPAEMMDDVVFYDMDSHPGVNFQASAPDCLTHFYASKGASYPDLAAYAQRECIEAAINEGLQTEGVLYDFDSEDEVSIGTWELSPTLTLWVKGQKQ